MIILVSFLAKIFGTVKLIDNYSNSYLFPAKPAVRHACLQSYVFLSTKR